MLKDLKRTCGSLTDEELSQVTNYLWPSNGIVTSIHYTFEQNVIPSFMEDFFNKTFPETQFFKASFVVENAINFVLDKWRNACDNKIEFKYIETPKKNFKGIIFRSCEFSQQFKVAGASTGFFDRSQNIRGKPRSLLNVLCVPKTLETHDFHLFSHEIGHALGLIHFHDVYRLKNHLVTANQGLGCSVMPYPNLIQSQEGRNKCKTSYICMGGDYAIYPGPLDSFACSNMYDVAKNLNDFKLAINSLNIENSHSLELNGLTLNLHYSLLENFTLFNNSKGWQEKKMIESNVSKNTSISLLILISFFMFYLLKKLIKPIAPSKNPINISSF